MVRCAMIKWHDSICRFFTYYIGMEYVLMTITNVVIIIRCTVIAIFTDITLLLFISIIFAPFITVVYFINSVKHTFLLVNN